MIEMGVVHDPYWEERGDRGHRGGMSVHVKPSGSGSISTLHLTQEQADEAVSRRGPLGFSAPPRRDEWGEADWTARDLR